MATPKKTATAPVPSATQTVALISQEAHDWLLSQGWTAEDVIRGFRNIYATFESKGAEPGQGRLKTAPYVEKKD